MPITLDGTNGITTPTYGGADTSEYLVPVTQFKNRLINSGMQIDQRNAGSATANTINGYTLDRWAVAQSVTGKLIAQQNAGSVTPPAGFNNYLGITSQSAYSILSTDTYYIRQGIEGFNFADCNWGSANAKTITLSFWVRSSLTGTFGGSLNNSDYSRSYPFSYTISSANTWEYKTVTIAGDTSGTWVGATNGVGLNVLINLGAGSSFSGTANAWASGTYFSVTGATNLMATNGATFYITGVQLEVGSTATSFEIRSYTTELQLCQRYYEQSNPTVAASGLYVLDSGSYIVGWNYSGTSGLAGTTFFKVVKRANPTLVTYTTAQGSTSTANRMSWYQAGVGWTNYPSSIPMSDVTCFAVAYNGGSTGSSLTQYNWTASAEL